jgi:UDP-N-acetylmuramate dehydrogenase
VPSGVKARGVSSALILTGCANACDDSARDKISRRADTLEDVQIGENVPLAGFTTLGIGGPARWLLTAATEADVADAVAFARDHALPLFVLGGGSNLLIADEGFPGVVLHMAIRGITPEGSVLRIGAGERWDAFVQYTVDQGLAGIECLAGIPGTVGGTPVQNVGAYGEEVAETITAVRCFDMHSSKFVDLSNADCGFAYRTSILNTTERGRYIVTRVDFALHQGGAPRIAYADLKKHFDESATPSLTETAEAVRTIRRSKSMVIDPSDPNSRSAGSFFRNPIVPASLLPNIADAVGVPSTAVPHWPAGDGLIKLPAAWLLEQAGFIRGYTMGNAGISTKHTLALVNRGGATAADIIALRNRIIDEVQQRFGVQLEQEPVSPGLR